MSVTSDLQLVVDDETAFSLTDWAFGQLCRFAQLNKQVMNRLTRRMASQIFQRTWPQTVRPWEILVAHDRVRDICGFSYARLWNCEVLGVLREFESHWQPPPTKDLSCGLFYGEQDLFCFLIEPDAWIEFDGSTYAPGVLVSNSEVGRRPLRVQAFWYQAVEHNHFLFDPIFARPFVRRHAGEVRQGLDQMRRVLEALLRRREDRRDAFIRLLRKANRLRLGSRAAEACARVRGAAIPARQACAAVEMAQQRGRLSVLAIVKALSRLSQCQAFIANRTALDARTAKLLALLK
jgi:hypothetical protein